MKASLRRTATAAAVAVGLLAGLGGCTRIRSHQGYVMDSALVASVQPGIDNRESVQRTLGDPSLRGEFDPTTWYYFSRTTRQFSFGLPRPVAQTVLAVHFTPDGTVASVERTGLNKIVQVPLDPNKTPTLGRKRGLFQELFGNIGAVGAGNPNAPTADNPNGGGTP